MVLISKYQQNFHDLFVEKNVYHEGLKSYCKFQSDLNLEIPWEFSRQREIMWRLQKINYRSSS